MTEVKKELETKIALYLGYAEQLEKVVKVSKSYDNKVMNKKFVDLVENAVDGVYISYQKSCYGSGDYKFSIISNMRSRYNGGQIFTVYDSKNGVQAFVINNRFNYTKFSEIVQEQIDHYKNKVAQMQSELKNGLELVEKYNSLIKQAIAVASGFSAEFEEIVQFKGGFISHYGLITK